MAHKTQVEFRSHFSGKKLRLMGREIWQLNLVEANIFSASEDIPHILWNLKVALLCLEEPTTSPISL